MSNTVKESLKKLKKIDVPFIRKSCQAFIKQVKDATSTEEERRIISNESSNIRDDCGQQKTECLREDLLKLIFIYLLGYPAHFGQMACLQLISSPLYQDKRVGYLAMSLFIHESSELLLLTVNSIKNDISSSNPYLSSLAITFCGNTCAEQLARDVFPVLVPLMSGESPYLRKKACLTMIKIVTLAPELIEDMVRSLPALLIDNDHGVLISAIQLTVVVLNLVPDYIPRFRKLVPRLIKRLRLVISGNGKAECAVDSVPDPFVQVNMFRLLSILAEDDKEATEAVADVVTSAVTSIEPFSVAGNSVLYECARTLLSLDVSSAHMMEAANILGKFLLNDNPDIRFISLSLLLKMTSINEDAVMRQRSTILSCLRENDPSIRRRALELIIALVRLDTVVDLVRELLQYLIDTEGEERSDVISKIVSLVQQFAPSSMWQVDTLLCIVRLSTDHFHDDVLSTLVEVISHDSDELACYTVHTLFRGLEDGSRHAAYLQTALWILGEYGDLVVIPYKDSSSVHHSYLKNTVVSYDAVEASHVLDMIELLIDDETVSAETKGYLLTALVKLTDRLDDEMVPRIISLIDGFRTSKDLELQQRACEFYLLEQEEVETVLDPVLDRMPPLDIDSARMLRQEKELNENESDEDEEEEEESEENEESSSDQGVVDLLGILDNTPKDSDSSLLASPHSLSSELKSNPEPVTPRRTQELTAYEGHGVIVTFVWKAGKNEGETLIRAEVINTNELDAEELVLQMIVPKYMQMQEKPLSCDVVPANEEGVCTQLFRLQNNSMGEKDTVVRLRVMFRLGEEEVNEMVQVDGFDE